MGLALRTGEPPRTNSTLLCRKQSTLLCGFLSCVDEVIWFYRRGTRFACWHTRLMSICDRLKRMESDTAVLISDRQDSIDCVFVWEFNTLGRLLACLLRHSSSSSAQLDVSEFRSVDPV